MCPLKCFYTAGNVGQRVPPPSFHYSYTSCLTFKSKHISLSHRAIYIALWYILKTSRMYSSKRPDHLGWFQSQHFHKRDLQMVTPASLLFIYSFFLSLNHVFSDLRKFTIKKKTFTHMFRAKMLPSFSREVHGIYIHCVKPYDSIPTGNS